ncbi:MAG TPA: hypothetical protein PLJ84_01045 [Bacteroidales bacterium]|nr:hypothetical protein [Bacteroidales bacterium]
MIIKIENVDKIMHFVFELIMLDEKALRQHPAISINIPARQDPTGISG